MSSDAGQRREAEDEPSPLRQDAEFAALYADLRALAGSMMGRDARSHTLQPTAVVHEAFARITPGQREGRFESREHFIAFTAKAMRSVLVDHARRKNAEKRGGDRRRVTLDGLGTGGATAEFDAADVSDALDRLEALAPRQARIVELCFFGGLTQEQAATLLNVSDRTVRNEWRVARAWIKAELTGTPRD
ncbi:MAG: ECF-type sigma factor [Planctomycetota bacterium]